MLLIHKASAGSGKTFSLARQYLVHILGQKMEDGRYRLRRKGERGLHRRILAITFTNKATEEMKSRIIHELAVLAGLEPGWDKDKKSPHLEYLTEKLDTTPDQIAEVSRVALKELLFDFNDFNVSTIDSFFQSVLRAFAHEAEVSGSYNVELDDTEVISSSVDSLLQDLNHTGAVEDTREIMRWLSLFMTKKIEDGSTFNIFNRSSGAFSGLVEFVDDIADDDYRKHEKGILSYLDSGNFETFRKELDKKQAILRKHATSICSQAAALTVGEEGEERVKHINANVLNPIKKWAEKGMGNPPSATLLKAAANIENAYKASGKKQPRLRELLDGPISRAIDAIVSIYPQLTYIALLRNNVYYLGLLSYISRYMRKFRLENSTILLSDTNTLLSAIIGDTDSPFLYEKIGTRFENYLIDEFQDTSYSQWHNLEHLVRESSANGGDNLVIGDEKQSIYRFRGSDSSLLHNLARTMKDLETEEKGTKAEENTNWRSSVEVIQFNNTLFSAISGDPNFKEIYSGVAQHISPKNYGKHGYVAVEVTKAGPKDKDIYVTKALDFMADNLRRQLMSGYKPGDIAILVRTRAEGEKVISHLQDLRMADPTFPRFNIVSDKSYLISSSPAVRLVVSTLRYLTALEFNPKKHKRSRKEVARIQTDFEASYAQSESPSDSLETAIRGLEERRKISQDTTEAMEIETKAVKSVDLYSLTEEIIKEIPERGRRDEAVFITAFQDMVADFTARGQSDIRTFLEWWDEHGSDQSVAGAEDPMAIKVLTVHKSKGLEFACVHVPFAAFARSTNKVERAWFKIPPVPGIDPGIQPEMMPLDIVDSMQHTPLDDKYEEIRRKRQLDYLNLLYVAFTRAVDELTVSFNISDSKSDVKPVNVLMNDAILGADKAYCQSKEAEAELREGEPSLYISLADKYSDGRLTIGKPTRHSEEKKGPKAALDPSKGDVIESYRLSEARNPWSLTRAENVRINAAPTARERGLVFHYILSQILTASDIPSAFARAKASQPENMNVDGMREIFERSLDNPLVAKWFAPSSRVLMEREALTSGGKIKRFDRVVWTRDGELFLIDYKTGGQDPKVYSRDMKEYIDFFKSARYPQVRAFLFFLDKGQIIEIIP